MNSHLSTFLSQFQSDVVIHPIHWETRGFRHGQLLRLNGSGPFLGSESKPSREWESVTFKEGSRRVQVENDEDWNEPRDRVRRWTALHYPYFTPNICCHLPPIAGKSHRRLLSTVSVRSLVTFRKFVNWWGHRWHSSRSWVRSLRTSDGLTNRGRGNGGQADPEGNGKVGVRKQMAGNGGRRCHLNTVHGFRTLQPLIEILFIIVTISKHVRKGFDEVGHSLAWLSFIGIERSFQLVRRSPFCCIFFNTTARATTHLTYYRSIPLHWGYLEKQTQIRNFSYQLWTPLTRVHTSFVLPATSSLSRTFLELESVIRWMFVDRSSMREALFLDMWRRRR